MCFGFLFTSLKRLLEHSRAHLLAFGLYESFLTTPAELSSCTGDCISPQTENICHPAYYRKNL